MGIRTLFKGKESPAVLLNQSQFHSTSFHLTTTDLIKQMQLIDLNEKDLAVAKALQPLIEANVEELVKGFYDKLGYPCEDHE